MNSSEESLGREPIREILNAALDLPAAERRAFVESRLSAGEARDDALSLLREVDELGDFLEKPPRLSSARPFEPVLPERIGSYRVERVLGWGSMGVVYLATQESPKRSVAVKVLRMDVSTPVMARRFAQEGEVLGRLSHPGIASVFESGVAELGAGQQPYLAMEFIDGASITRFAADSGLDRRGRVALVERVARAVAHAHGQGVLHRDLKPENVLVKADGTPVVLDFGVAHSTLDQANRLTLTATGQVIGTLAYMAPEQARGATVDARADQFALGAMLFELLTGELPFDIRGRLPHEALRTIADGDCRLPTRHDPSLSGDLEAILTTALASEPVRRYPDVAAFADDLQRWLDRRSIVARPPSRFGNLRRFVGRNRALSAVVVFGLLALGAGIAWGTSAVLELRRESAVSLLLSDRRLLQELETEAQQLWPTTSDRLSAFDSWMARAAELHGRLPQQRAALAILDDEQPTLSASGLELEVAWLLTEGRDLIDAIESFATGLVVDMSERRRVTAGLFEATLLDQRAAWQRVAERVRAAPRFDGFDLPPQEGLIPLGPDPHSGLEEFSLWISGETPRRDTAGALSPRPEHALVMVLIPGGQLLIGAQTADPEGANYDPAAEAHERPAFSIQLDPFLLSKYEMTQAQWQRAFAANPSDWEIGSEILGQTITGLHPVESMSWEDACRLLRRLGLTLPTEAQWERGARGDSPWACLAGPSWADLAAQASWNTRQPTLLPDGSPLDDDGYYSHMPVGRFPPNGYGLHDVMGNVWEYCLDTYKVDYHALEHRSGDGLVLTAADGDVSRRGACCASPPHMARVYWRSDKRFDGRDALTGLRPARPLDLRPVRE